MGGAGSILAVVDRWGFGGLDGLWLSILRVMVIMREGNADEYLARFEQRLSRPSVYPFSHPPNIGKALFGIVIGELAVAHLS